MDCSSFCRRLGCRHSNPTTNNNQPIQHQMRTISTLIGRAAFLAIFVLSAFTAKADPILITAGTTAALLSGPKMSQSEIDALIAPIVGSTEADYKNNQNDIEEGVFADAYSVDYGVDGLSPNSFEITWDGPS